MSRLCSKVWGLKQRWVSCYELLPWWIYPHGLGSTLENCCLTQSAPASRNATCYTRRKTHKYESGSEMLQISLQTVWTAWTSVVRWFVWFGLFLWKTTSGFLCQKKNLLWCVCDGVRIFQQASFLLLYLINIECITNLLCSSSVHMPIHTCWANIPLSDCPQVSVRMLKSKKLFSIYFEHLKLLTTNLFFKTKPS